jgi:hypothetical protein
MSKTTKSNSLQTFYKMYQKPKTEILEIKSNNGKKLTQTIFEGKKFTRDEIQTLCQELGKELSSKVTGTMHVSMPYPRGWRSGGWTKLGELVKLSSEKNYDMPDPKYYNSFMVFVEKSPKRSGGLSSSNSCFFDSLSQLIPKEDLPWSSDIDFKKDLKLSKNDEISIDLVPKIQEKLSKYKLILTGDHTYISTVISHQEVKIQLIDGHYSPLIQTKHVHGIATKEKIPMIFKKDSNDRFIVITP